MHSSSMVTQGFGDVLEKTRVRQLIVGKRKVVEVPYTASVGDTLHTMLAHNIVEVAVAAPPGHWIGAGGSMILESDRCTGTARKHYIGIVSTLDVLVHLSELKHTEDASSLLLGTRVSNIIGHCLEGLSLWAINPETSVLEAMKPMSKGLHRVLVPLEGQMAEHSGSTGLESEEASPGYCMLTQTDLVQLLHNKSERLHTILSQSVEALGVVQPHVFGVPADMTLIDTIKCMTEANLMAVAVLEPEDQLSTVSDVQEGKQLVQARGRRIVGTFSASDLRGCSVEVFQCWAKEGVLRFLKRANVAKRFGIGGSVVGSADALSMVDSSADDVEIPLLTCLPSSSLAEVISNALEWKVHRVWMLGQDGTLVGVISFTDVLRAVVQCIHAQSS